MRIQALIVGAVALFAGLCTSVADAQPGSEQGWGEQPKRLVKEAHAIVAEHFFDPSRLEELDWDEIAVKPTTDEILNGPNNSIYNMVYTNVGYPATIDINRMFDRLGASHCAHYNWGQREYYDLLDIFSGAPAIREHAAKQFPPDGRVRVASAGFTWAWIDGYRHAAEVFPGSIADRAGMRAGDGLRILGGNHGEVSVLDHLERADASDLFEFDIDHRGPWHAHWQEIGIDSRIVNPTEEYLELMTNSVEVIKKKRKKLGYVRIYSWAGQRYQDRLEELLQQEPLASADGVVLDIRGGWGGANPQYLDLFGAPMPTLTQIPRDGEASVWDPSEELPDRTFYWRKPVVLLVDGGTRSGKEIIAYAFKKHGIGPVVGARTAGAVLAGRPFILSDGSLLYLAVADVLVDGERLEGVGVEPDIAVERDLPFSNGADPQLEAALGALVEEIRGVGGGSP